MKNYLKHLLLVFEGLVIIGLITWYTAHAVQRLEKIKDEIPKPQIYLDKKISIDNIIPIENNVSIQQNYPKQPLNDQKYIIAISEQKLRDYVNETYTQISTEIKDRIMDAIFKYSKEYSISPLIVMSIIHTESSFKFWKEHPPVTITITKNKKKKKVRTKAIGLGGIIWEVWGDKLKEKNIAKTKSDLYIPEKNIHATIFIFKELMDYPKLKFAKNQTESALLRYYGVVNQSKNYFKKIDTYIGSILRKEIYQH